MRVSTTKFQNAFGKYLKLAIDKEDVIVTKNGRGVAKLIRYEDPMVYVMKESTGDYLIRKSVTYDDFIEISDTSEARYELINGEIFLMASPKHKHQVAIREIFGQMYNYFADKGCSPLTAPFDVRLRNGAESFEEDPNVVQPDILVMCDEDQIDENDIYHGVPSLVVEVLSPSTRSKDMIMKLSLYMRSGVDEYWIVDVENKQVYVYVFINNEIKVMRTYGFGAEVISEKFEGLRVVVA
jgi:prevent-host-death family protein